LNHLKHNLRHCDIVREIFSVFTSRCVRCVSSLTRLTWVPRYDEIRTLQVNHLRYVWSSGSSEESKTLHKNLDKKIDSYAAGELKHAAEAISSIWNLSRKKEAIPCITPADDKEECIMNPEAEEREKNMRTSLIKSIQGRPLLFRRYWARKSRGGSVCPVYFPSAMPSSTMSRVATCEWR
jgi:hypothetical protein